MDALTVSTHRYHSRIPAPTVDDPLRTRWCEGSIHRTVYGPDGWMVESCDNCQYYDTGFVEAAVQ